MLRFLSTGWFEAAHELLAQGTSAYSKRAPSGDALEQAF